jgi:SAM-dependent methyltransferase
LEMHGNQYIFEDTKVIGYYARASTLTEAEAVILRQYRNKFIDNHRVLDLGVGTGRTVPSFAPTAAHYVGIDYSHGMIALCKANFPRYRIEHGDARDLSRFANDSFDCVLFSYNGLDFVDHSDRLMILDEVARVLAPGGIFVFSSHNLRWRLKQPLWRNLIQVGAPRDPLQASKRLIRIGLRCANYLRYRKMQSKSDDHAVLLDPGHDFTLPIYNVDPLAQAKQLRQAGFAEPKLFDEQLPDAYDDRHPYCYYYVARKRQVGQGRFA